MTNYADLKMDSSGEFIKIVGQDFNLKINKETGDILEFNYKNTPLLLSSPKPNFWRPPTDNDLGNGMHKWAAVWKRAGQNAKTTLIERIVQNKKTIAFYVKYELPKVDGASVKIKYTVQADGTIIFDYHLNPSNEDLPKMPRVGMQFKIPSAFQFMEWYGKGPHETYWDRKSSGEIAIWKGTVWEQMHRYPRPQETGNKTEVRWMSLKNNAGVGLMAIAESEPLSMSAWQLDMNDLGLLPGKKEQNLPRDWYPSLPNMERIYFPVILSLGILILNKWDWEGTLPGEGECMRNIHCLFRNISIHFGWCHQFDSSRNSALEVLE